MSGTFKLVVIILVVFCAMQINFEGVVAAGSNEVRRYCGAKLFMTVSKFCKIGENCEAITDNTLTEICSVGVTFVKIQSLCCQ
ncbi:hypothetical protein GCK72_025723 [Caenorhabditis remanei]|uniref:Uncharacterized protein n=1 Tax=Caenorhabditis remanei TaxID=31234 RepID=A0A6A5G2Y4_CAERE|nr:hypothetical protein GCK72_025723 [Caenorhabditis remanei]KAF1749256.1 hypothetical protein GCK72_025723 [Caenorhabditis remanei]